MKKKDKPIEPVVEKPITPEEAMQHFIATNQSQNRHTRRSLARLIKMKIVGTNKPYIKNEDKRKNTRATVENKEVEKLS
jgi:hypothetical protein